MSAQKRPSRLPWLLLIAIGLLMMLAGAFAGPVSQWIDSNALFRVRLPLLVVGALLVALGVFKRSTARIYKESVVMIANTALLLLALEFVAAIALTMFSIGPAINEPAAPDGEVVPPPSMERQQTGVKHARYVSWLGTPQQTGTLSIDEHGLRVTPFISSEPTKTPIKLFAFGGSTMWGEGVRDDQTIASYLQQALSERLNHPVQVTNFGQRGWVSTQGLAMLLLQLQQGNVPDVVVFYDGYNDTYAPNSGARPGHPEDFDNLEARNAGRVASIARFVQSTNIGRLLIDLTGFRPQPTPIDVPEVSGKIVQAYLNVYRMTGALAKEYGFARRFFWQPQLLTESKPLTPFEQQIFDDHPWNSDTVKELTRATYDLMANEAPNHPQLSDLTNVFGQATDPIYFDPCHVLPVGNKKIAQAMIAAGLEDAVRAELAKLKTKN